ncbi:MAG: hypothetical protein AB7O59_13930 [Pirellulales bacterium]
MNKAFLREPDETGALACPACGSLGVAVTRETWSAHVADAAATSLAESAFFCPYDKCQVVYFDMFDRRVGVDDLRHGVYPKDPQAPICACFGMLLDNVRADARAGIVARVRELVAKAKSAEAHCQTAAASGQSCVAEVQRWYLKERGGT